MAEMIIDGVAVEFTDEKNLLEVVRKAGIELPTFCYHSELSIYGACRMCMVEVEGRGMVASCSVPPEEGLVVRTNTPKLQRSRRMILELLLANHHRDCTTCEKSGACKLQDLAQRMGVRQVRFGYREKMLPIDTSSPAIVRDPNKCILCGDCVRGCSEVQGIGVLDFANRGSEAVVSPAFGKNLADVDCVNCGQCVSVCPTGALVVRSEIQDVFEALNDPEKVVVAQLAPAVRVAIGEEFGLEPGQVAMGQMVASLKKMGFAKVFDTSFAADLTVLEETHEFLERLQKGEKLPQFTSCCPGWVKYAEQYHPELLDQLSSCRSPQQMFGSVAKRFLAKELGVEPQNLVVVSIMPCTAKKFEAKRPEFTNQIDGVKVADVDHVLTTGELARMIKEYGLDFNNLEPESLDMPFGLSSGAGMLFGNSGGVAEAVLRAASEMATGQRSLQVNLKEVRGLEGIREAEVDVAGTKVRLAVVHSRSNVKELLKKLAAGEVAYDLIELMACPGGCIGGGGQPIPNDTNARAKRRKGLYSVDRQQTLRKSQDNPLLKILFNKYLIEPGGERSHQLLHSELGTSSRFAGEESILVTYNGMSKVEVGVCVGTCCYLGGSYNTLQELLRRVKEEGLQERVDVRATFCLENCAGSPSVQIGDEVIGGSDPSSVDKLMEKIKGKLQ